MRATGIAPARSFYDPKILSLGRLLVSSHPRKMIQANARIIACRLKNRTSTLTKIDKGYLLLLWEILNYHELASRYERF